MDHTFFVKLETQLRAASSDMPSAATAFNADKLEADPVSTICESWTYLNAVCARELEGWHETFCTFEKGERPNDDQLELFSNTLAKALKEGSKHE